MAESEAVWQAQKRGRRWQAVNATTGEVIPLSPQAPARFPPHVLMFQEHLRTLATRRVLSEPAWCVLIYLLGCLDFDNWAILKQTEVAKVLQLNPTHVSRVMKHLVALGLLQQAKEPVAPRTSYRLNSQFAYRGRYTQLRKRRREEGIWPLLPSP